MSGRQAQKALLSSCPLSRRVGPSITLEVLQRDHGARHERLRLASGMVPLRLLGLAKPTQASQASASIFFLLGFGDRSQRSAARIDP